jgi:hypothetical protein
MMEDKMTADKMTVNKMTVDKMTVDKMTRQQQLDLFIASILLSSTFSVHRKCTEEKIIPSLSLSLSLKSLFFRTHTPSYLFFCIYFYLYMRETLSLISSTIAAKALLKS